MENKVIKIDDLSKVENQYSYNKEKTAAIREEINLNDDLLLTSDDLVEVDDDKVVFIYKTIPIFTDNLLKKYDPVMNKLDPKYTDDFWFVGRESIVEFCKKKFGFSSWHTAKTWQRFYAFPVRFLPNGEPFLIYIEAINWALMYDNIVRDIKREKRTKNVEVIMKKYGKIC